MKYVHTMKELFNILNPKTEAFYKEGSFEYTQRLAAFTQGYGRGVLDTINQRKEMEEESK